MCGYITHTCVCIFLPLKPVFEHLLSPREVFLWVQDIEGAAAINTMIDDSLLLMLLRGNKKTLPFIRLGEAAWNLYQTDFLPMIIQILCVTPDSFPQGTACK